MDVGEEEQVVVAGYDLEKGTIGGTGGESASRVPCTSTSEAMGEEKQQQRQEQDTNGVWWDSDDDRENPLNWTAKNKWMNLALPSFITFITYAFPYSSLKTIIVICAWYAGEI